MDILKVLNVYTDVALTSFAALRNHSVRLRCSAGTCPAYSAFRFKSSCYQGRCQCNGENYQQKNCLRTLLFENCHTFWDNALKILKILKICQYMIYIYMLQYIGKFSIYHSLKDWVINMSYPLDRPSVCQFIFLSTFTSVTSLSGHVFILFFFINHKICFMYFWFFPIFAFSF